MNETGNGSESRRQPPSDRDLARATPPAAGGREVRVGVFVVLGLMGILTILFLLTDPGTFRGRYNLVTVVSDAGGVRGGDPVQMRGVNIGRVRDFSMENDRVSIVLEINGRWRIPTDSRARIAGAGLLGGRTIEIVPGTASETLRPGSVLVGETTADITDLASSIGIEVEDLMGRLQRMLSDSTVHAVQGTAEEARLLVGELHVALREEREGLRSTLASARRSAEGVEALVRSPELERTLARADSTMDRLNRTSMRLEEISSSLDIVVGRMARGEGTLGLLSTDEELYQNLSAASASLDALLQDIRENPGRYIRLRIF